MTWHAINQDQVWTFGYLIFKPFLLPQWSESELQISRVADGCGAISKEFCVCLDVIFWRERGETNDSVMKAYLNQTMTSEERRKHIPMRADTVNRSLSVLYIEYILFVSASAKCEWMHKLQCRMPRNIQLRRSNLKKPDWKNLWPFCI